MAVSSAPDSATLPTQTWTSWFPRADNPFASMTMFLVTCLITTLVLVATFLVVTWRK